MITIQAITNINNLPKNRYKEKQVIMTKHFLCTIGNMSSKFQTNTEA